MVERLRLQVSRLAGSIFLFVLGNQPTHARKSTDTPFDGCLVKFGNAADETTSASAYAREGWDELSTAVSINDGHKVGGTASASAYARVGGAPFRLPSR